MEILHEGLFGSRQFNDNKADADYDVVIIYLPSMEDLVFGDPQITEPKIKDGINDVDFVPVTRLIEMMGKGNFNAFLWLYSDRLPMEKSKEIMEWRLHPVIRELRECGWEEEKMERALTGFHHGDPVKATRSRDRVELLKGDKKFEHFDLQRAKTLILKLVLHPRGELIV